MIEINAGLPKKSWNCKDDPKLLKYDNLKLAFWFLHSIETGYYDGLLNNFAQKKKRVLAKTQPWMQENGLKGFCITKKREKGLFMFYCDVLGELRN